MKILNLYEILEDCPKNTILYSPLYGDVKLLGIDKFENFGIKIQVCDDVGDLDYLTKEGKVNTNGECVLFPSKDNKDWSTFNIKKFDFNELTLFQQVLVRENAHSKWCIDFFGYIDNDLPHMKFVTCGGILNEQCVPYNEDTAHLVGTTLSAPDFYDVRS